MLVPSDSAIETFFCVLLVWYVLLNDITPNHYHSVIFVEKAFMSRKTRRIKLLADKLRHYFFRADFNKVLELFEIIKSMAVFIDV